MMEDRLHPSAARLAILLLLAIATASAAAVPELPWLRQAPPLPAPTGKVLRVASARALLRAAASARHGTTILIADGHYTLPGRLHLTVDGITLRSASGDRHRVVLDGGKHKLGELVAVSRCQGVTIADLSIANGKWNGFKINSNTGVHRVTIRNCVVHNLWQRGVKGVQARGEPPRECIIEHCLFYNDRPKEYGDDETDTPKSFGGNYVGAIDVMDAHDWAIRDNVFVGIQGRTREGRGAVFVWVGSRGCRIERNTIIDCDAGIALGNPSRGDESLHCQQCVVRNNFITRAPEQAIFAAYTADCRILHNTIEDPDNPRGRSIRAIGPNANLVIENNLISGPPPSVPPFSKATLRGNVVGRWSSRFVDAAKGNLHLKQRAAGVVDAATALTDVPRDFDGQPRDKQPDVGADEFALAPPAAPAAADTKTPDYVARLKKLASGFRGKAGVVLHVGDSITYANPYSQWARYGQGKTERDRALLKWMHAGADDPTDGWWLCRVDRPGGRSETACGGIRADQMLAGGRSGMPPLAEIVKKYQPQMVLVMLGTNDASAGRTLEAYLADMAKIADTVEQQHAICILSTIPPHHARRELAASYNEGLRALARERKLPLIDYEQEILTRQPDDWNGTLLGKNDVHPTGSVGEIKASSAPTEENLATSGYLLRAWLSVRAIDEVKTRVVDGLAYTPAKPAPPAKTVARVLQGREVVRDALIDFGRPDLKMGDRARGNALRRGDRQGNAFLIRFELKDLKVPAERVERATLSVFVWDPSSQGKAKLAAAPLVTAWSERAATWRSPGDDKQWRGGETFLLDRDAGKPGPHVVVLPDGNKDVANPPLEYKLDVTSAVRDWLDGKRENAGLAVTPIPDRAIDDGLQSRFQILASEHSETRYTPKLTLQVRRPPD